MRSTQQLARGAGRSAASTRNGSSRPRGGGGGGHDELSVRAQAAETVAEATRKLKDKGGEFLDRQKRRAAAGLEGVGSSIRQAAGDLRDGPLATVGGYVESAADAVAGASSYLAKQDLRALRRDVEEVVRGRPQLFLGGMFVIGLALARFAKAGTAAASAAAREGAATDRPSQRERRGPAKSGGNRRRAAS